MPIFNAKFFQLLKTFNAKELKAFELWVKSPWANSNKNLIHLLEKIRKYYPAFDNPKLTKEKLFKQVLPDGKFSDRRMNNLLSEAYLTAERFMIFNGFANNEKLQKDILTQELQSRHLEDWFFKAIEKEIKHLEATPIKEWEDYLDLLLLQRRVYHHPNQSPRMQPGGQTIVQMGQQLDVLFLLEKAAIINEKIARNRILKNENHAIDQELELWLAASASVEHLALKLYRMRFAYREETMLKQYLELRTIFLERFRELNKKEQKIQLISLLNDTVRLIRSNHLEISETLPLYKIGLDTKLILNRGILSIYTFRTIVAASNYINTFDYTHQFIANYIPTLKKEFQQEALNWAKIHTFYWQQNYNEALNVLITSEFKSTYFQLVSRVLGTQIYFDLFLNDISYNTYFFDYLNAFEKWIIREKIGSTFFKQSSLKFIKICRSLARIYISPTFESKKIALLFETEDNIQAIKWLHKKREDIIRKRKKSTL